MVLITLCTPHTTRTNVVFKVQRRVEEESWYQPLASTHPTPLDTLMGMHSWHTHEGYMMPVYSDYRGGDVVEAENSAWLMMHSQYTLAVIITGDNLLGCLPSSQALCNSY